MFGRRPQYSEVEVAMARQRSFVGAAVAVFILYWFCYLPGLLFNIMWLSEAGKVRRIIGAPPAGTGCLQSMLLIGSIPLIFFGFAVYGLMVEQPAGDGRRPTGGSWARAEVIDLSKVVVEDARVEVDERQFGPSVIYARFDVTNTSNKTLTSAKFLMEYKTPGRAVAWSYGENETYFDGGVEPGETREVEFIASIRATAFTLYRFRIEEIREDAELLVNVLSVKSVGSVVSENDASAPADSPIINIQSDAAPAAEKSGDFDVHPFAPEFETGIRSDPP